MEEKKICKECVNALWEYEFLGAPMVMRCRKLGRCRNASGCKEYCKLLTQEEFENSYEI